MEHNESNLNDVLVKLQAFCAEHEINLVPQMSIRADWREPAVPQVPDAPASVPETPVDSAE